MTTKPIFALVLAAIVWGYVVALQRPPPRYSQQYMPQTSFTCRNKIVGSYYADPETDCQLFHVCVSVAGSIQDYRFLCPNDTAFDQESQTCADWYDVDCEAATLYYASDNFDLYRIGSGLESLHYDSIRSDLEPQDHLQRSESNDPIRSPLNSLGSYSKPNARAQFAKQYTSTTEANPPPEPEKPKPALRNKQQSRKPSGFSAPLNVKQTPAPTPTTTAAPATTPAVHQHQQQQQQHGGRYNGAQNFASRVNLAQSASSSSTPRPNGPRFAAPTASPTYANYPTSTFTAVTSTSTGAPTTLLFARNTDYRTVTPGPTNAAGFNRFETTARPTNSPTVTTTAYNQYSNQPNGGFDLRSSNNGNNNNNNKNTNYNINNNNNNNNNNNYNNDNVIYSNHNYNIDVQKTNTTTTVFPVYQNHNYNNNNQNNNNNNNNQNNNNLKSNNFNTNNFNSNNNNLNNNNNNQNAFNPNGNSNNFNNNINNKNNNLNNNINNNNYYSQFDSQSTKKAIDYKVNTYAANTYAPTTYSPVTKKFNNNRVYYDKSTTLAAKSVQYAETDSTKSAKKATYFKSFQNGNFESSTKSYEFEKSSVAGLGFSPSSVNHLAENVRSTTPTPRRSAVAVTTYNPNNFNVNSHLSQNKAIQQKTTSYQNPSTKQYQTTYSTTAKFFEETTTRPKITKKNDYDYAYYDNVEYDNLELEHVTSNKESVKIA